MDLATARRQTRKRQRVSRTRDSDSYALGGGLNLVDPPVIIKPGYVLAAENYEIGVNGGYESLGGFERFDGSPAPSDQSYSILAFRHGAAFSTDLRVGQDVTGAAAGAATIIEAVELAPWGRCYNAYADDLSNALWTTTSVMVDPASIALPETDSYGVDLNGTTDDAAIADSKDIVPTAVWKLTEGTANSEHAVVINCIANVSNPVVAAGDYVIASVFAKLGTRRYVRLALDTAGTKPAAVFDLQDQAVISSSATVASAYLEDRDYGDGWCRLVLISTAFAGSHNAFNAKVGLVDDTLTESYVGSGGYAYVTGLNTDKRAGAAPNLAPFTRSRRVADLPINAGIAYLALYDVTTFTAVAATQGALSDSAAVVVGTWSGGEQSFGGPTAEKHLDYLQYVANLQRANIDALPGNGQVRGVWFYAGKVYGFRDDLTVCKMYKSTSSGWSEVVFSNHLDFDAGLAAGAAGLVLGATVNGATSGATGVIARLGITNPGWGSSVAVGTLVLTGITGAFQNNEVLRVGATAMATVNGVKYVPTWDDGGRYRFRTFNFYGAADKRRMYGVNGLNRGFEYDEADGVLFSMKTGMTVDAPERLCVHHDQLVYGFPGGSVQRGAVGNPGNWTVTLGADELAVGDDITDFLEEIGDTLVVFTRSSTLTVLGNVADGYSVKKFDPDNGAIADSVQRIGFGIHLDDRGFTSLTSANEYGNYQAKTFSRLIQPLVNSLLKSAAVTESLIHKSGNRYRCFFDDGRFISIGVAGQKITGHMVCNYGKVVHCAVSAEDTDGSERVFFGSDDGYVYEAGRGTSFDGEEVAASLRPAYHYSRHPDRNKTYRAGRIEAILQGPTTLYVTADLTFGKVIRPELDVSAELGGAIWEHIANWEEFNYDESLEPLKSFRVGADGLNIGLLLRHVSARQRPHTLRAVVFQSTLRGINRGARTVG